MEVCTLCVLLVRYIFCMAFCFKSYNYLFKQNIVNSGCHIIRKKKVCHLADKFVAVVVEWLACLPVTQKIRVRFYLERENSTTSGWINAGREWCCRGWSIEGGTPGGFFRTRDGLSRIRKARAARNVHKCESVCAWNKKKHCICAEMAALYECLYVCCISLHMYIICMCSN